MRANESLSLENSNSSYEDETFMVSAKQALQKTLSPKNSTLEPTVPPANQLLSEQARYGLQILKSRRTYGESKGS